MGEPIQPAPDRIKEDVKGQWREVATSLCGRSDVAFVHLGSVYELVGLSEDVLQQFCTEAGRDRKLVEDLFLERPIVTGLQSWTHLLQQIPSEWLDEFNLWFLNQMFVRRHLNGKLRTWWRPRRQRVEVPEPTINGVTSKVITVHFYLPFGNVGCSELDEGLFCPHQVFRVGQPPYAGTEPDPAIF